MSPTRYSSLFRNRWTALIWAAGICWGAVEFTACTDIGAEEAAVVANSGASTDDAANLNQLEALVSQLEKK